MGNAFNFNEFSREAREKEKERERMERKIHTRSKRVLVD